MARMGARHMMTPKRKAQLKRAQEISARKRRKHGGPTPTARRRAGVAPAARRRRAAAPKLPVTVRRKKAAINTTRPKRRSMPVDHKRRTGVHTAHVAKKRGMSNRKKAVIGIAAVGAVAAAGAIAYQGHKVYKGQQNARSQALNHTPRRGVKTLYHLTQKQHVESILKTGIRPSHYRIDFGGGSGFVHVTENIVEARKMAARFQNDDIAILAVKVKRDMLEPDTYEGGAPHYRIRPHGVLGVRLTRGSGGGVSTPNLAATASSKKRAASKAKAKAAKKAPVRMGARIAVGAGKKKVIVRRRKAMGF